MTAALEGVLYGANGEVISSPETRRLSAIQRQKEALRARFDAAQTTNENTRHWSQADYLGPNSELDAATRRILRSRARYECANNSYAAGIVRTLANDTIGTGPSLVVTDSRFSKEDAAAIEDLFWEWCSSIELATKLRQMRLAKVRDGETFAQMFTNPAAQTEVQLDVQPFEADCVAATSIDNPVSSLLDGLIVDDFGNVIAYNVLDEHPGEQGTLYGKSQIIPAAFMIHIFHSDRPGQYRGCPELTSTLPLYAQLRRYTLAVLRASESAAIPSWLIETQQPPSNMTFGDAFDKLETERGMGVTLPAGYKMSQLKAEHPTSTYPQFKREIVSEQGRGVGAGVPFNIASGDSSSYNYSSGRLDHRTYYKSLRVERSVWEHRACTPLFRKWFDEARRLPNYLPPIAQRFMPRHEWRWDGDEHVDPTKEADAAVTRIGYGLTSIIDEVGRLGGDVETVHRKNSEALGLSIEDYRKRLADKFFGATVASSSQDTPEPPASNPFNPGVQRNG